MTGPVKFGGPAGDFFDRTSEELAIYCTLEEPADVAIAFFTDFIAFLIDVARRIGAWKRVSREWAAGAISQYKSVLRQRARIQICGS